ncbi:hypothetical protein [Trichormus azollae]|uniref:Low temperature-induced protein n=1 Tax=Nostoc azollae (strain 0708) TaxID=551115 RepID=D7E261_NOSA0|nr:hypothetical protein [Trichormus azollae]ADI63339.1 low temperature-induced protein ['Nostoc azollae' 0708]
MEVLDFVKSRLQLPSTMILVVFTCSFIFLFHALPALAISSYQNDPTEGPTQLLEIQRKTDEAAKEPPIGMKESQEKTRRGLNEVQGEADFEKMKRPENSQSANSVEQEVEGFLEEITGSNKNK